MCNPFSSLCTKSLCAKSARSYARETVRCINVSGPYDRELGRAYPLFGPCTTPHTFPSPPPPTGDPAPV